jgi:hypothetical protein
MKNDMYRITGLRHGNIKYQNLVGCVLPMAGNAYHGFYFCSDSHYIPDIVHFTFEKLPDGHNFCAIRQIKTNDSFVYRIFVGYEIKGDYATRKGAKIAARRKGLQFTNEA